MIEAEMGPPMSPRLHGKLVLSCRSYVIVRGRLVDALSVYLARMRDNILTFPIRKRSTS